MQPLTVSLVQGATRWHDAAANRKYYGSLVRSLDGKTDLVILPETFLTGFTNDTVHQSEPMDGEWTGWLRGLAGDTGAVVTGSLVVRDGGSYFNRLIWMRPDGNFEYYDKRHLFRMAGEHTHYAGGQRRLTVTLKGWKIRPLVCYDLRFPVWSRNRRLEQAGAAVEYDLLFFVANWPAPRHEVWRTLLRARAIENLSYCIGVNRVGRDGNGLDYAGDSAVINPLGEPLVELGPQEQVITTTLRPESLLAHRERFPAWMDADAFEIPA